MKKTDTMPLAYAYAEDGKLYTSFCWKLAEADYFNAIGKELVNFAYLDGNQLYGVMRKLYGDYAFLAEKQPNKDVIADVLLEKYEPWFRKNTYFAVYLMSILDYLIDGRVDERVFPGTDDADRELRKIAKNKRGDAAANVIDPIFATFQSKRELAEAALRAVYEDDVDDLAPVERYYRHEQEDPEFQKQLSATFTVKLGRRSTGDRSVTQLTVLDTVDDLLRYELFLLVTQGKGYKYCKNCGKPFIPSGRSDMVYCDRVMDGADKPCSEIGAYLADVKKVASDPVLSAYRKAYQRLHKRVELGYMDDDEFTRWKDEAAQKRDRCTAGELDAEEFLAWVDATSRRR
ncbi:MAG: hypothetical protein J5449_02515 [Oscillospiraceae bacterium]|nr:hypothetical protein [Oscillospiraceae bacterium]